MGYDYTQQAERVEKAASFVDKAIAVIDECLRYERHNAAAGIEQYEELRGAVQAAHNALTGFRCAMQPLMNEQVIESITHAELKKRFPEAYNAWRRDLDEDDDIVDDSFFLDGWGNLYVEPGVPQAPWYWHPSKEVWLQKE